MHFALEVDDEEDIRFHGVPFDIMRVPGICDGDNARILYHAFDEMALSAQLDAAVITTGRRADLNRRRHASVIWSRDPDADMPRIGISPNHEIALFHRPTYLQETY